MLSVFGLPLSLSATELLLASAIFCLVFWVVRASRPQVPKGMKSPPGPWGWPLVGHMLSLGKSPHLALAKLSRSYGDVLQIRLGSTPVLVLSGLDTIRQALVRQGDDFKGRPDLHSFTLISNGQSMTFNPDSGPVWAARRRLAQNALKSFSMASDPASSSSYLWASPAQGHVRDITDSLIEHCQDKKLDENANIQLSDEKIVNIVLDLFGAGFDTVTTAISWSLMYMVTNPGVQRKIQEELDTVVGRARRPRLSDRPQLPYMEAFILETFRHSSFVPFTIPHSTTRDTNLNGFYVPKGCCVFVNQWQVNHDPKLWGDPSQFRPERFLTPEGGLDKELSEKVLLFGMGKRKCIGETIARLEVFLFLAILLQQVEFSVPPGVEVDMTPLYGL